MTLTHQNLGIWIVTYNRPDELNANIRSLRESVGDLFQINVISNHTQVRLDEDYGNIRVIQNTLRPDESWGYLARNWNQCYYLGLAEHENILVSQDDMVYRPGWLELINSCERYDFYSAPIGDLAHLTSRAAFLAVGWWDERFVGIDYQDYDYLNRVHNRIPQSSSVVDRGLELSWNDIGLCDHWIGHGNKGSGDRPRGDHKAHNRMNRHWYGAKRGLDVSNNPRCHKDKRWRDINIPSVIPEIDWYPWFTAKMQRVTGQKQQFCRVPYTDDYGDDGYG